MKLKKHMELFIKVLCRIISRDTNKRFHRDDLKEKFNNELSDKRLTVNTQQLVQIIKRQNDYEAEKTLKEYLFKEKEK